MTRSSAREAPELLSAVDLGSNSFHIVCARYPHAALIKACVNRETRRNNTNKEEELAVSLDESNPNIGYRLGRPFAALEKIQQEANPGINATIRDRFYGAASSTPVTVFGNLMRLKNHHLAKLESAGRRVFFEKLLGQRPALVHANPGVDSVLIAADPLQTMFDQLARTQLTVLDQLHGVRDGGQFKRHG